MSGPDPSKLPFATAILRDQQNDVTFEADFADLARRFAAESGGGLTPELSADLALEIVLNEIVEQACRVTGATGAAIVLERGGFMVCRASSGTTAPQLGSPLDIQAGLAAECLRTRRPQCCDDTLSDIRADAEASERVGVRSVLAYPLLRGDEPIGLFELFSTEPFAFGVRDERALEALADRTLATLYRAEHPVELEPPQLPEEALSLTNEGLAHEDLRHQGPPHQDLAQEDLPYESQARYISRQEFRLGEPFEEPAPRFSPGAPIPAISASRPPDLVVWFLGIAVVAASVLLGVVLGRRLGPNRNDAERSIPPVQVSQPSQVVQPTQAESTPNNRPPASTVALKPASATRSGGEVPPGGLRVLENGREVFRMAPAAPSAAAGEGANPVHLASDLHPQSVVDVPEEAAYRELVDRIEPEYPEAARQQSIQGPVVLDVHIGKLGTVQDVHVISGPTLLAQASTDAVKQWRFRPRTANGRPVEMQTRITLNFRLDR